MSKKKSIMVWKLYPEGMENGAYIVESTKDLKEAILEIGERSDCCEGDRFIIEAALMTKDEFAALEEFDGF